MAKLETTEEFVLKLHEIVGPNGQTMINDEFPELFFKWQIGNWHKLTWGDNIAFVYSTGEGERGGTLGYGFGSRGQWNNDYSISWGGGKGVKKELATPEEIESILLKEAEKRGYKKGVTISWGERTGIITGDFYFTLGVDNLAVPTKLITNPTCNPNLPIFYDGKWAEIVIDPNKDIKDSIQRLEAELAELKSKVK